MYDFDAYLRAGHTFTIAALAPAARAFSCLMCDALILQGEGCGTIHREISRKLPNGNVINLNPYVIFLCERCTAEQFPNEYGKLKGG